MAKLSEKELRTVIEDTRIRSAAVVAMIFHADTQASSLLRLFLTVGVAAASGAFAAFPKMNALSWALGAASIQTVIGSLFCLLAMASAKLRLLGNEPDFWIWASRPDVPQSFVLASYLDQLQSGAKANADINEQTATALKYAKGWVVATIATTMAAGALALRFAPTVP